MCKTEPLATTFSSTASLTSRTSMKNQNNSTTNNKTRFLYPFRKKTQAKSPMLSNPIIPLCPPPSSPFWYFFLLLNFISSRVCFFCLAGRRKLEFLQADDVADFEWLSHFVEDSFSEFSAALPIVTEANPTGHTAKEPKPEPENPVFTFKTPVQTKARSKRSRNGVRVWPLGSPSFTESSSSSTTTTSSSSSSSPSSPLLIYTNFPRNLDHVNSEPKPNKPKKKHSSDSAGTLAPRRCSHCGVQKTPQWRTGPLGPKTLCNACGVRFKSGRLLPEYRPACSPTFSSELHSNHHRKVLEMRQKKEMMTGIENGFTPAPVPKF